MDVYREIILDHYKHPHNFGHLSAPDAKIEEENVSCGDKIIMEIRVDKTKKKVVEVRFNGTGCAISMASASLLTDQIREMSTKSILELTTKDVLANLGTTLTPTRVKCAVLPLEVLQKTVQSLYTNDHGR